MFDFTASQRAQDVQAVPNTTLTLSNVFGLFDNTKPDAQRMKRDLRGLFYSLLDRRANNIAKAVIGTQGMDGFRVMRVGTQGDSEEVEPNHPWVNLIRRPNPAQPPYKTWHWASMACDATGSADFIVEDGPAGVPEAMYPIYRAWGTVRPKLDRTGAVDGWVFHRADGRDIPLEARDIVRFTHGSAFDPADTMGLIERAVYELDHEYYSRVYEQGYLQNGRPPNVYLSYDGDVDNTTREQVGQKFKQMYMGAGQGRAVKGVPVMDKGGEIKTVALSPGDLMMLDSRQFNEERLYDICGVPYNLKSDTANRSNAQVAERTFARDTIGPRVTEMSSELTFCFERSFGAEPGALEVEAPDVMPVDREQEATITRVKLETGQMTLNEVRERDGLEPYDRDEADQPLVSSTVQPLGATPGFL